MDGTRGGLFQRLVHEPLVHFLAIGAAIFALNAVFNPGEETPEGVIEISQGRIAQLEEGFRAVSGRGPGPQELRAIVDDFVMEEIAYREAIAMGLDADDTVVRRRMRQKLDFLLEDMTAINEPTEAELREQLAKEPLRYSQPAMRAIRQVLASEDRRGAAASRDAQAFLGRLRGGANPEGMGDASMLPSATPLTSEIGIATLFGDAFAAEVFKHGEGEWFGPVKSVFGYHAVEITHLSKSETPAFEAVREQVRNDIIQQRRIAQRQHDQQRLLNRYDVRIDWPGGKAPEVAAQ